MVTLGMEEEVQVVDAGGELVPHDFAEGLDEFASREGAMDREIHRCVIELKTRICHGVPDLVAALHRTAALPAGGTHSGSIRGLSFL